MEDSKLIQLVKTFSKSEINEFGKFVNSPFFNESPKLALLYELLLGNYPEFPGETFNKQEIFKLLYPEEQKYDDKKVRSRVSLMLGLAEEFLIQMEIKKDTLAPGKYILNQYISRKLDAHFTKKFKQQSIRVNESNIVNENYFLERYQLVKAKRDFYEFTKPYGKREEHYREFSEETELLVKYSVMKLIKHYVLMKCDKAYINFTFDYSLTRKLLEYIEERKYTEYPIFEIFRNLLLLEEKFFDEALFEKTKNLFYENIPAIDKEDAVLIITELYSLATRYFYAGNNKFVKVPFEIVTQMLKHEIYPLESGYMAERQYLDTVYTAFAASENSWAEDFINNFKMKLNPEVRNNAFNYSISMIELMRGDYQKALGGFAKVKVADFYYYIRIKYNKLRIYFEMGEFETIFSEIDSFKHYLSKNKVIPEDIRSGASNFINFFSRLVNAMVSNDYTEISLLKDILEDTDMEMKRTMKMMIIKILGKNK